MEGFKLEDQIKNAVVPLPDEFFLADIITKEADPILKLEEQELKDQLERQKMYEELFVEKDDILPKNEIKKGPLVENLPEPGTTGWERAWLKYLYNSGAFLPKKISKFLNRYHREGYKMLEFVPVPDNVLHYSMETYKRVHGTGNKKKLGKLQYSKDSIMGELRARLQNIDKGVDYPESEELKRATLLFDNTNGKLYFNDKEEKRYLSEDDIVADFDWGIKYRADASMPKKIWRRVRKLSDINEAKVLLQAVYNRELVVRGYDSGSAVQSTDEHKEEIEFADIKKAGLLAEKMVVSLLKRRQSVYSSGLFRVEPSNSVEDSEFKYDFSIQFIPTESTDTEKQRAVGFQLTITPSGGHKNSAVKKANEILLTSPEIGKTTRPIERVVLMRAKHIEWTSCYKQWLGAGKPSGGPEQYLSDSDKENIINAVMKEFLNVQQ